MFSFQVQKIRELLRNRGLSKVRVGTVDDYQGQEERIIFISTVPSTRMCCDPTAKFQHTCTGSDAELDDA